MLFGLIAAVAFAGSAMAGPVTLKTNPVDDDGRVTFGDLFDGAGAAAGIVVGNRAGPSVVFEAGQLQSLARQSGLDWANPTGLRRVVVRQGVAPPAQSDVTAQPVQTAALAPRPTPARAGYTERVISRNDIVEVAYEAGGIRLTISGRAEGNAVLGQRLAIRNLQSNRVFDAVATGPGLALAGPAARSLPQQFASR